MCMECVHLATMALAATPIFSIGVYNFAKKRVGTHKEKTTCQKAEKESAHE